MPKYYIQSGQNQEIFDANDPNHALAKFVGKMISYAKNGKRGKMSDAIAVSEQGFSVENKDLLIVFFDQALALYNHYTNSNHDEMY